MKKFATLFSITACFFFFFLKAVAQNSPVWTQTIDAPLDTATVFPVKTQHDGNNNIYVLSTYLKTGPVYKIRLNKYSEFGNLLWSTTYDNSGIGNPCGFDMAVDNAGNCYIAGAFMFNASFFYKPLLLKVSFAGNVMWMRDSVSSFYNTSFSQIILKNDILYLSLRDGVAAFDSNGNELWSNHTFPWRVSVDNIGQMIVSGFDTTSNTVFRFDSSGVLNFSDSSLAYAERIAADFNNNIYLLSGSPQYELVKYDSSGILQWNTSAFPTAPPFGDIGFDVLTDNNNDVILVGISDTMFKFSPAGNLIWRKPMNGLDSYLLSAEITFSNLIAVAGTMDVSGDYEMAVALFDLNGNQNWQGYYNGTSFGQEYTVDLTIDNSGIYVVENFVGNTTLVKFASPFLSAIDYGLICVDSIWYDALNPVFINVRVFNGNTSHLNYPSVQIVSPANDTIGNPSNWVSFFAHLGNTYQIYSDTITQAGITDFSNYTFLISEGFGDTTVVINWCGPLSIAELNENEIRVYPNPAHDVLYIKNSKNRNIHVEIYNATGKKVFEKTLSAGSLRSIDISTFKSGIYFMRLSDSNTVPYVKFLKL